MGILKRFHADRHVRLLQAGGEADGAALAEARSQLESMGAEGVRSLLGALGRAAATTATTETLAALVNPATLPLFISALRAPLIAQADAAEHALAASQAWDPLALLPALDAPDAPRGRLERVLEAQAARVPPAHWLRALPALAREVRPFEIGRAHV